MNLKISFHFRGLKGGRLFEGALIRGELNRGITVYCYRYTVMTTCNFGIVTCSVCLSKNFILSN